MENEIKDDGSLACLNIPRNADSRSFNCDVITQSKLCNREFYVLDYIEDVPTRYCNSRNLFTHIIPQEYASII